MVKISSGVDRESEKNSSEKLRLLSPNWFMRRRLVKLIRRLQSQIGRASCRERV